MGFDGKGGVGAGGEPVVEGGVCVAAAVGVTLGGGPLSGGGDTPLQTLGIFNGLADADGEGVRFGGRAGEAGLFVADDLGERGDGGGDDGDAGGHGGGDPGGGDVGDGGRDEQVGEGEEVGRGGRILYQVVNLRAIDGVDEAADSVPLARPAGDDEADVGPDLEEDGGGPDGEELSAGAGGRRGGEQDAGVVGEVEVGAAEWRAWLWALMEVDAWADPGGGGARDAECHDAVEDKLRRTNDGALPMAADVGFERPPAADVADFGGVREGQDDGSAGGSDVAHDGAGGGPPGVEDVRRMTSKDLPPMVQWIELQLGATADLRPGARPTGPAAAEGVEQDGTGADGDDPLFDAVGGDRLEEGQLAQRVGGRVFVHDVGQADGHDTMMRPTAL